MRLEEDAGQPGFDILFYDNPQPMWIYNAGNLQIIEANNAALLQYGYTKDEFLNKSIIDLRPPEDINILHQTLSNIKGHNTNLVEYRHQSKDGSIFFVEIHSYSIIFRGVEATVVHTYNIQERKNVEHDLEVLRFKLEKILETISMGFCQLDGQQQITYWNSAMEELIGYNRADVMGKKLWEVLPEMVNTDFYTMLKWSIENEESVEYTEYFWPLQKWLSVASHPTGYGQTIHLRDSTSKIQFQKSLIKKIEQLKDVSYLNSHLIRKPVATLLGLTNLISDGIIEPKEFKKVAEYINECSHELDEVVRQVNDKISGDARHEGLQKDLGNFPVLSLLDEINSGYDYASLNQLVIADNTNNLQYYGNQKMLKTAIECLINNSIKYSSLGSNIIIQAEIIEQNLVITVQYFGVGIDNEMLNRLFLGLTHIEKFENLGSGLNLVAEVVRNHHGTVWIESERGVGSVFSLSFPLSNIAANFVTGKPDFSVYKEPVLEIDSTLKNEYLTANYKGFHDPFSVKAGSKKILDTLNDNKNSFSKILIDDTDQLGVWDGVVEWIAHEWVPQVEKAGVKHIAVVYSKCTFTKVSVDNVANNLKANINYKTFDKKSNAIAWLTQQPAA